MKKILAVMLAMALLATGLTACSKTGSTSSDSAQADTSQTEVQSDDTAAADGTQADAADTQSPYPEGVRPLTINSEPYCVTVADGFDNAGFTVLQCDATDTYTFTAKDDPSLTWSIFVRDELFDDVARLLPQAESPALTGDGELQINQGQYLYVQCSKNAFTDGAATDPGYLEIFYKE